MELSTPMGSMTTVLAEKAPDMKVIIQKMNGNVMQKQIFTPDRVIMKSATGEQEVVGEQFEKMKHQGIMHPELDYAKNGYTLKLVGSKMIDGKKAYQLEVVAPGGVKTTNLYDVESGFLVEQTSAEAGTQKFSEYKEVDGIMFPYAMTIESPMGEMKLEVKKVEVNKGLDDKLFE